ncbi:MAG: hypothetical protein AMXMBFR53_03590 [Gemmatimonadota bacterium]
MTPGQRERTEILALSIDDRDEQKAMLDRVAASDGRPLEFPLLSDPDHSVVARYGLLNQQDPQDRPIPHPTVFVVDREGVVRWKFIEVNYKIRPTNEDILSALAEVQGGGP